MGGAIQEPGDCRCNSLGVMTTIMHHKSSLWPQWFALLPFEIYTIPPQTTNDLNLVRPESPWLSQVQISLRPLRYNPSCSNSGVASHDSGTHGLKNKWAAPRIPRTHLWDWNTQQAIPLKAERNEEPEGSHWSKAALKSSQADAAGPSTLRTGKSSGVEPSSAPWKWLVLPSEMVFLFNKK